MMISILFLAAFANELSLHSPLSWMGVLLDCRWIILITPDRSQFPFGLLSLSLFGLLYFDYSPSDCSSPLDRACDTPTTCYISYFYISPQPMLRHSALCTPHRIAMLHWKTPLEFALFTSAQPADSNQQPVVYLSANACRSSFPLF